MFSIVIPIYNKEPHLRRSIDSVLNQTFGDFELILVEDASTDDSRSIIESYVDPRIRVFFREKPGPGGYAARNLGIKQAKFDWVAFLDADDEWGKARLAKLAALSKDFPGAQILSSGWNEFFTDEKISQDDYSKKYTNYPSHYFDIYTLLLDKQPIWTSVAVVKKDLLLSVKGFDEKWKRGADLELWLRLLLTGAKGAWLNERTAVYYKNATNMVTLNNPFINSPIFPTVERHIRITQDSSIKLALIKFNNRINYGVTKSLLLKGGNYRQFFWRHFGFDLCAMNKVFMASLILILIPKPIAIKLVRKRVL